jgi:hypothetical protein
LGGNHVTPAPYHRCTSCWNFQAQCIHGFYQPLVTGNTVTGDGTSTVSCSTFYVHVNDTGDFSIVS